MPVHGEYRHLVHHAQLARDVGIADDRVLICEDGDVITLTPDGAYGERRAVPAGYMYVDGILYDTAGRSGVYASRWQVQATNNSGYVVRHYPGL